MNRVLCNRCKLYHHHKEGTMQTYIVVNTGVNEHGAAVLTVRTPAGQFIEIATNVIGMAKLAQVGVPVCNSPKAKTGKVG